MTSVERILEYCGLPPEAAYESSEDKLSTGWPHDGSIVFDNASFRYSEKGSLVLKDICATINSNEKIGIVGRTGAGKSSLISMLFRMAEPSGKIFIDDVDIKEIGLYDLRSCISIIPQDPVLFQATVRKNLDPFDEYSDVDVWNSLTEVQLKPTVAELPLQLESPVSQGGTNFSVGQRQLLCLARALLKKNKILILDEATANVDPRTDALIQETIREKFNSCTVLTIAHRINTIMDSDRIMVLDAGKIVQFGSPASLLEDTGSLFYAMLKHSGRM